VLTLGCGKAMRVTYSVSSLSSWQSACAAVNRHLWPVWLCHITPFYLINGTIFGIKLLVIKCVLRFSVHFLSEIFLILRRMERDMVIYEGHLESKERFAIKKYLLIIRKKKNMQVLSHNFTYFST